ncbi:Uncharacterised protein [Salmonella enterica subsp. enterica]|nr:Uncharacterised protein [Salmonella enterica subsp. enterica] [Salmonella enterica subsp. enterica serovar Menston]
MGREGLQLNIIIFFQCMVRPPLQLSKVHPQGSHDVWGCHLYVFFKLREIIRHQVW